MTYFSSSDCKAVRCWQESGGYGNTSAENVLKYLKKEDYSK